MILKKIKQFLIFTLLIFFFSSCGYKVINKSNGNYYILEITDTGEDRLNYKIKNQVLFQSSKQSKNILKLKIKTKKQKQVRDRNIKNEITSYILTITTEVMYNKINSKNEGIFTITESGDYKVSNQRLNTLNNEKSLTETLTNKIISKIIFELNKISNDN